MTTVKQFKGVLLQTRNKNCKKLERLDEGYTRQKRKVKPVKGNVVRNFPGVAKFK